MDYRNTKGPQSNGGLSSACWSLVEGTLAVVPCCGGWERLEAPGFVARL